MKTCPACNRAYADDSLRFCLDDGTVLVISASQLHGAQPTLRMSSPAGAGTAPTEVVQPRQTIKALPPGPTVPSIGLAQSSPPRRRRWPIVSGIGVITLGLLLIITFWWIGAQGGDELLYQTQFDHTTKMQLLLLIGVNVNARDNTGSTALMGAAWRGQTDAVKILLDKSADVNVRNFRTETALLLAAKQGNTEIVRLLLDKNPDVNAKDDNGWTSLMWAAWGGHQDTAKVLLNRGAEVRTRNNYAETAVTLAEKKNHYEIVDLLMKADENKRGSEK